MAPFLYVIVLVDRHGEKMRHIKPHEDPIITSPLFIVSEESEDTVCKFKTDIFLCFISRCTDMWRK